MSTFEIRDDFYLDGEKFQIISGSIHYFRVPPEYWRDRLLRLKALGCNTVETYVPWNFHEPEEGKFDFTGARDVEAFLRTARELGLWAIVRPSPYICAEWEFGGLPAWLLREDNMRLRCCDAAYLRHVERYYDELMPRLAALQATHGGPILLMQVENEYGSYGDDTTYLAFLRDAMRRRSVDVPLVTSDGPTPDMFACGRVEGVFPTGNFGSHTRERFAFMAERGVRPQMCMEYWCGWFDHWGQEKHARTDAEASAKDFADALALGHINIYMFHGGTSFGLMNGSNDYDRLTPDVTSYDYDALLSEDGRETEKYRLFRAAIHAHTGVTPPESPAPLPRRAYGEATLNTVAPLLPLAGSLPATHGTHPVSMERLGQSYGYTLYRTTLTREEQLRDIRLVGAADRAHILLDGVCVATLYDRELLEEKHFDVPIAVRPGAALDILVENLGRVNYSYKLEHQRKGIDGGVVVNGHLHTGWDMIPLDERALLSLRPATGENSEKAEGPSLSRLTFQADELADTFLELPGWGKGVVFLNGFTLGRFWEIGPQKRLYVPAPLLKRGENELLIVETEGRRGRALLMDEPDLG